MVIDPSRRTYWYLQQDKWRGVRRQEWRGEGGEGEEEEWKVREGRKRGCDRNVLHLLILQSCSNTSKV